MFCGQCGHENADDNRFCENCGAELSAAEDMQGSSNVGDVNSIESRQSQANEDTSLDGAAFAGGASGEAVLSHKKRNIIIIAIAAVVLAAAAGVFAYANHKNLEEYNSEVDKAKEYMESKDYEKAEAAYLAAIDMKPKQKAAYIGACDLYIAQENYTAATEILEQGQEAGCNKLDDKLAQVKPCSRYLTYTKDNISKKSGMADIDKTESAASIECGLVSALMGDFDGDEIPELLTVTYGAGDYDSSDGWKNAILFSLYECEDNEVELVNEVYCDDYFNDSEANFTTASGRVSIFLREHDGKQYIIVGNDCSSIDAQSEGIGIYAFDEEGIKEETQLTHLDAMTADKYEENGEVVGGYGYDSAGDDMYYSESEEGIKAHKEGMAYFEKAMATYGIAVERFTETPQDWSPYDGYTQVKFLSCDAGDESETNICYIQRGETYDDGNIKPDSADVTYIEDYTNIRETLEKQGEKDADDADSETSGKEEAIAEAESRGLTCYEGKVYVFDTDEEMAEFQGTDGAQYIADMNDENDCDGGPYTILALDKKKKVTAWNGDGDGKRTKEASMIDLEGGEFDQYEGENIVIGVDLDSEQRLWWQSDASLPVDEPRADKDVELVWQQ